MPQEDRIQRLVQAITGFDIDPLAVILAKINWVVAARDWLEPFGKFPVIIPIYHADSLFAITPLNGSTEEDSDQEFHLLTLAGEAIKLPKFLLTPESQTIFDGLIERAYSMATSAGSKSHDRFSDSVISKAVDSVLDAAASRLDAAQRERVCEFVKTFTVKVDQLNREGKNGIWAFILRNSYRPGLVKGQFNGLVSNVPWLALSKIANNPYHSVLRKKAEAFGIKPAGSSHLHIELATIFLLHAVDRYLESGAAIGCITPETILNGHHHNPFRAAAYVSTAGVEFAIQEIWRVEEGTFDNNAIVLFGQKMSIQAGMPSPIPGALATKGGSIPLSFYRQVQGSRTAWSDQAPSGKDQAEGFFRPANFRQGADVMPRTFFLFEAKPNETGNQAPNWQIKSIDRVTSPVAFAVKDAKKQPTFQITPCAVPDRVMFNVLTSNLLTPFALAPALKALLPIHKSDANKWEISSAVTLAAEGTAVQNVFKQICAAIGEKATVADIGRLLNVRNKLTQQIIEPNTYIVFTGAGGDHVCSAFIKTNSCDVHKLVIDQTLYWAEVATEDEALYLTGLFNSEAIGLVIHDFQPKGAFGARHVHKLPFGVTPPFDKSQASHQAVVDKTRLLIAEYEAAKVKESVLIALLNPNTGSLAKRRSAIKARVKKLDGYLPYEEACRNLYSVA